MASPSDSVESIHFLRSTRRFANVAISRACINRNRIGEAFLSYIKMLLPQWHLRLRVCYDFIHMQAIAGEYR